MAGSHPNTRLVRRQRPRQMATIGTSTLSASRICGGIGSSVSQGSSDGMLKSTIEASAPPAHASTIDSDKRY